jgi:hypothetical protein
MWAGGASLLAVDLDEDEVPMSTLPNWWTSRHLLITNIDAPGLGEKESAEHAVRVNQLTADLTTEVNRVVSAELRRIQQEATRQQRETAKVALCEMGYATELVEAALSASRDDQQAAAEMLLDGDSDLLQNLAVAYAVLSASNDTDGEENADSSNHPAFGHSPQHCRFCKVLVGGTADFSGDSGGVTVCSAVVELHSDEHAAIVVNSLATPSGAIDAPQRQWRAFATAKTAAHLQSALSFMLRPQRYLPGSDQRPPPNQFGGFGSRAPPQNSDSVASLSLATDSPAAASAGGRLNTILVVAEVVPRNIRILACAQLASTPATASLLVGHRLTLVSPASSGGGYGGIATQGKVIGWLADLKAHILQTGPLPSEVQMVYSSTAVSPQTPFLFNPVKPGVKLHSVAVLAKPGTHLKKCKVCMEGRESSEFSAFCFQVYHIDGHETRVQNPRHPEQVCSTCLKQHCEVALKGGKLFARCPVENCGRALQVRELQGIVEPTLYATLMDRLKEAEEQQMLIQAGSDDMKDILLAGIEVKRCPRCNVKIEKNGGCSSIQCYRCGTNFNWDSQSFVEVSPEMLLHASKAELQQFATQKGLTVANWEESTPTIARHLISQLNDLDGGYATP